MTAALHYRVEIQAPRARVWERMLGDAGYREWTAAFCEGSYYEGRWETGAAMRFLSPQGGGMRSRIAEARAPELVRIEHLGMLYPGQDEVASDWQDAFESYRLVEQGDGSTLVEVELSGVPEDFVAMMDSCWPLALSRLRALCER